MTQREPLVRRRAREWTLLVCPQCGAEEAAPPTGCDYCETGGQLVAIVVVQKATA